jgi:hypothetical protein
MQAVIAGRFAQFRQYSERAFGVDERDPHVVGAGSGDLINHPNPCLLQLGDPVLDARDGESDVMESLAPLVQERRDRAGRVGRLQQFQPDVADPEESDADLLVGNLLDALKPAPRVPS